MATSGSWDYSLTAANLILMALEDINAIADGETVTANDEAVALRTLNLLAKQWQGTADSKAGFKVWTRQRITLFLAKGQRTYTVGPASTDSRATTSYGRTTLSAAEAGGQTVISITSNTDTTTNPGTTVTMISGDIVAIEMDDGTLYWSTISGTPAATMTITAPTPSAAASGNYVYWFTSRAQRFPTIEAASLRNDQWTDTALTIYTDVQQYEALTDKVGSGDPVAILIEPLTLNTRVTLDVNANDVTKQLRLTVIYPAEDYDAAANDIAYPQEYFAALEWELAFRLAPKFQRPWTEPMENNRQAAVGIASQLNSQTTSLYFQQDRD